MNEHKHVTSQDVYFTIQKKGVALWEVCSLPSFILFKVGSSWFLRLFSTQLDILKHYIIVASAKQVHNACRTEFRGVIVQ